MRGCVQRAQSAQERAQCLVVGKEEFANSTRGNARMAGRRAEAHFEQLTRGVAEAVVLEKVEACIEPEGQTLQQMTDCMGRARTELSAALEGLLGPSNNAQVQVQRKLEMEKEAAREVLGAVIGRCVQCGTRLRGCERDLEDRKVAAGLADEAARGIVAGHFARLLARPARDYSALDMRQRREDAKLRATAAGMEAREYAVMKRVGEVKAAAEMWASCEEVGNDDAACEGVARDEYVRMSGMGAADFDEEVKSKAKSLARALRDGQPIRVVHLKRIVVDARASGSACAAALEAAFAAKIDAITASSANSANTSKAVARRCRMVASRPEYGARVAADLDDWGMANLADSIVAGLQGATLQRRLQGAEGAHLGRRLESLNEVFAAQGVVACAASDAPCLSGAPSPAPQEVGGAGRVSAAAALSLAAAGLALF